MDSKKLDEPEKYLTLIDSLIKLPPGMQYRDDNNYIWIRMFDSIDHHLEGYFFNIQTGYYKHASQIVR